MAKCVTVPFPFHPQTKSVDCRVRNAAGKKDFYYCYIQGGYNGVFLVAKVSLGEKCHIRTVVKVKIQTACMLHSREKRVTVGPFSCLTASVIALIKASKMWKDMLQDATSPTAQGTCEYCIATGHFY